MCFLYCERLNPMSSDDLKFRPLRGRVEDAKDVGGKPATKETSPVGSSASSPISAGVSDELFDTALQVFWRGASGTDYIHTVHSLIGCPEISDANYLLVRSSGNGQRTVLAAGFAQHSAPSLNLAEVRRVGATLGANEVHVHFLNRGDTHAKIIAHDLREAHLPSALPRQSELQH